MCELRETGAIHTRFAVDVAMPKQMESPFYTETIINSQIDWKDELACFR